MISAVADTHAFIWYLFDDPRLSPAARIAFTSAAENGSEVGVSSITLAEIVYLAERGRIPADTLPSALKILQEPDRELVEVPVDHQIVRWMNEVLREEVPEMPDRIVVATGLRFGVPIISRDGEIRAARIQTIW